MRRSTFLTALAGFGGILLLTSSSVAQGPGGAAVPNNAPTQQSVRPVIAVFNMAAVMRDYDKAKYKVWELTEKRKSMTKDLEAWKGEYVKLQKENQGQIVPDLRDRNAKRMVELSRFVEDRDREVNKILNEDASKIISDLYDEIKTVVDKTAEMNGYHIVFAYPDAVGPEESKSPMVKELKLKPPAAQPFFVAKQVDVTAVVVQTLNAWYPSPKVPVPDPQHPPGTPAGAGHPPKGP